MITAPQSLPSLPEDEVDRGLIDGLASTRALQVHCEEVFELLATQLPEMGREIRRLLQAIETLRGADREAFEATTVTACADMTRAFESRAGNVATLTARICELTRPAAGAAAQMHGAFRDVAGLGLRLRFLGLNAACMPRNGSPSGRALTAITQELVHLGDQSAKEMGRVTEVFESIDGSARTLLGEHERLEELHRAGTTTAQAPMNQIFAVLDGLCEGLVAVVERANDLSGTIREIVLALQEEDILRQGLDHALNVIEEIQSARARVTHSTEDRVATLRLEHEAGILAAALLDHISTDLRRLVDQVLEALRQLEGGAELLEAAQSTLTSDLELALRGPAAALAPLQAVLDEQLSSTTAMTTAARTMVSRNRNLRGDLERLRGIRVELASLALLLRTEIARTPALASFASIAARAEEEKSHLDGCIAQAQSAVEHLDRSCAPVLDATGAVVTERGTVDVGDALATETRRIEDAGERLNRSMREVGQIGSSLASMGRGLRQRMEEFGEDTVRLQQVAQACREAAERAHSDRIRLVEAEPRLADVLPPPRLQSLVERFTVLSHKQLGSEITNGDFQEGDEGGTLTLF